MEVSRKKSHVVASALAIAVAIAQRVKGQVVKPAFHAKLLGGDLVGGAKLLTVEHQKRLRISSAMRPQFRAIRVARVEVQQVARATGTPAFLYSNENFG